MRQRDVAPATDYHATAGKTLWEAVDPHTGMDSLIRDEEEVPLRVHYKVSAALQPATAH